MVMPLAQKAPMVYDSDYYTGCQASIYIGDIWVDEITGIQFEVIHSKTPIFGYASQFWDAMGRGVVMVRGSFTINFKEAGYMFLVLSEYQRKRQGISRVDWRKKGATYGGATRGDEIHPYLSKNVMRRWNVERAINLPPGDPESLKFRHDMASFVTEAQAKGGRGIDRAEDMMEEYEDAIWGRRRNGKSDTEALMQSARRADDHRLSGFDIYVQLGDFTNGIANHTMNKLVECHITGQARTIATDDEPIQEAYSFLAKTIV